MSFRVIACSLLLVVGVAPDASAVALFIINSNGDASDASLGDGVCDTGGLVGGQPECTLRAAIEEANAYAGVDFLNAYAFIATDPNGFVQITPQSPLPAITESAIVDFSGAPGYDSQDPWATPIFQLDGSQAGAGAFGLRLHPGSFGSVVLALAVHGFDGAGVYINGLSVTMRGCHVGIADGQLAAANGHPALWVAGDDARIGQGFNANHGWTGKGNVISANSGYGVILSGDDAVVTGNRIGTDPSGTTAMPNGTFGVWVNGTNNAVGAVGTLTAGGDVGSGNVIAGHGTGIAVISPAAGTTIEANFVGTDATGTVDLGSVQYGVAVLSDDTTVGSIGAGSNLISGNDLGGIQVQDFSQINNIQIIGNRIGVTADESSVLGNGGPGITATNANVILIHDNVIGGNSGHGVEGDNQQTLMFGNLVGTNSSGDDLGNGGNGVHLFDSFGSQIGDPFDPDRGNTIAFNAGYGILIDGAFGPSAVAYNTIGSGTPGEGAGNGLDGVWAADAGLLQVFFNTIGENGGDGISLVGGTASQENPIGRNEMFENVGIGIDLGGDGPTANDVGDGDTGVNKLQNFPVFDPALTTYNTGLDQIEVRYRVDTNLGEATYPMRVEFYLADADAEEGAVWVGFDSYPEVSAGGFRTFAFTPPPGYDYTSELLLATAEDADRNTSEFGDPVPLPEPGLPLSLACGGALLAWLDRRRRDG